MDVLNPSHTFEKSPFMALLEMMVKELVVILLAVVGMVAVVWMW